VSEQETHPPEEGFGAGADRQADEDAQRYPGHEDPDAAREEVGLDEHRREGAPEEAPDLPDAERPG
jgi:hypothetical protein